MSQSNSSEPRHPIQVVVRRTGLTADVLRAWERRYEAVTPARSDTGRRLYSDHDIDRLTLLRRATQGGRAIGQVADLSDDELKELVKEDREAEPESPPRRSGSRAAGGSSESADQILTALLEAVEHLDAREVESLLARALVRLSHAETIDHVMVPLMQTIGDRWREGSLRVAHEHLATAAVRSFMGEMVRLQIEQAAVSPGIVITTPAGQLHELGSLVVAAAAAAEGWDVSYMGPNLPAGEIAAAAVRIGARAVALSITYPADDPNIPLEIRKLRRSLPEDVAIIAGGRACNGYSDTLREVGAVLLGDMTSLRAVLEGLRQKVA